jgi:hypothetical protein
MNSVDLFWPEYALFPYEEAFALKEVAALLSPVNVETSLGRVRVTTANARAAKELTYFRAFECADGRREFTVQHQVESETAGAARRQSTRYSVHGLHEYKGKFNPQVARSLLNSAGLAPEARVLDPYCGSGTTLVECAHLGFRATGTDMNPLAVLIANAKLRALQTDPDELSATAVQVAESARRGAPHYRVAGGQRGAYLRRWFELPDLRRLESTREAIQKAPLDLRDVLLVIASNLVREFSLQEPADLRIRRRTSPPSKRDFFSIFVDNANSLSSNLRILRRHVKPRANAARARQADVRNLSSELRSARFDAAITSPPYAMVLPYIDTQRLSLAWLSLASPALLGRLQAGLVGSREFNGTPQTEWHRRLDSNAAELPVRPLRVCRALARKIASGDGFRRQAVPPLLYRYLADMRDGFRQVRQQLKKGAPYFLIVGHNHTVLGGKRIDLPTPNLLAELAEGEGFALERREDLETYQRYGLHQRNSIAREQLLVFRAI